MEEKGKKFKDRKEQRDDASYSKSAVRLSKVLPN